MKESKNHGDVSIGSYGKIEKKKISEKIGTKLDFWKSVISIEFPSISELIFNEVFGFMMVLITYLVF